jgi:hypothetical protein
MKAYLNIIVIVFLVICLISCEIKFSDPIGSNENTQKEYILAGILEDGDSLMNFGYILSTPPVYEVYGDYNIDINGDSIDDFQFISGWSSQQAGWYNNFWTSLKSFNRTEILIDTSMKDLGVYFSFASTSYDTILSISMNTPSILSKGDSIDSSGIWFSDSTMYLCYRFENDIIPELPLTDNIAVFTGWSDLDERYLGYRVLSENDTIYGWLNLKMTAYNIIYLGDAAYR